ncbi:MAG: hypothetical protein K2Y14_09930 [Burkholderiales bacterium]|nr:hypothetical protein [Burkholderiales bacterium]
MMVDNLNENSFETHNNPKIAYQSPQIVALDTKNTILGGDDFVNESEGGFFGGS